MFLHEYQESARLTAQYPNVGSNTDYPSLGLIGEFGELTEKFKKSIRDDNNQITEDRRRSIIKEAGDVFWYLSNLCSEKEIDLSIESFDLKKRYKEIFSEKSTPNLIFSILHLISELIDASRSEFVNIKNKIIIAMEVLLYRHDIDLSIVLDVNICKLQDRKNRGVISGSGDNR